MKGLIARALRRNNALNNDLRETEKKIRLLKSVGVEVSVINKNSQSIDGYMLGEMKDKYSKCKYRIG